jgi:hypothetical protein
MIQIMWYLLLASVHISRCGLYILNLAWGTFPPLVLSHAIENQDSDFVMQKKLTELYCMTKSEF